LYGTAKPASGSCWQELKHSKKTSILPNSNRSTSGLTVHEVSDGCPRLVNQVCEHALIVACTRGASQIIEAHVREAWADVQGIPGDWSAPETSQQDTSELQNDDGWTVIEFGQLDDDAEESEPSGTVYDFENSEGQDSSVDPAPQQVGPTETVDQEPQDTELKEVEEAPDGIAADDSNSELSEGTEVPERILAPVLSKRPPRPSAAELNALNRQNKLSRQNRLNLLSRLNF